MVTEGIGNKLRGAVKGEKLWLAGCQTEARDTCCCTCHSQVDIMGGMEVLLYAVQPVARIRHENQPVLAYLYET